MHTELGLISPVFTGRFRGARIDRERSSTAAHGAGTVLFVLESWCFLLVVLLGLPISCFVFEREARRRQHYCSQTRARMAYDATRACEPSCTRCGPSRAEAGGHRGHPNVAAVVAVPSAARRLPPRSPRKPRVIREGRETLPNGREGRGGVTPVNQSGCVAPSRRSAAAAARRDTLEPQDAHDVGSLLLAAPRCRAFIALVGSRRLTGTGASWMKTFRADHPRILGIWGKKK